MNALPVVVPSSATMLPPRAIGARELAALLAVSASIGLMLTACSSQDAGREDTTALTQAISLFYLDKDNWRKFTPDEDESPLPVAKAITSGSDPNSRSDPKVLLHASSAAAWEPTASHSVAILARESHSVPVAKLSLTKERDVHHSSVLIDENASAVLGVSPFGKAGAGERHFLSFDADLTPYRPHYTFDVTRLYEDHELTSGHFDLRGLPYLYYTFSELDANTGTWQKAQIAGGADAGLITLQGTGGSEYNVEEVRRFRNRVFAVDFLREADATPDPALQCAEFNLFDPSENDQPPDDHNGWSKTHYEVIDEPAGMRWSCVLWAPPASHRLPPRRVVTASKATAGKPDGIVCVSINGSEPEAISSDKPVLFSTTASAGRSRTMYNSDWARYRRSSSFTVISVVQTWRNRTGFVTFTAEGVSPTPISARWPDPVRPGNVLPGTLAEALALADRKATDPNLSPLERLTLVVEILTSAPKVAGAYPYIGMSEAVRTVLRTHVEHAGLRLQHDAAVLERNFSKAAQLRQAIVYGPVQLRFEDFRSFANACWESADYDEAVQWYTKALEVRRDDPAIYNGLALSLLLSRKSADYGEALDQAEAHAREAVRQARESAMAHDQLASMLNNLGLILDVRGAPSAAVLVLQEALWLRQAEGSDQPNDALADTIKNNLVVARTDAGRPDEALSLAVSLVGSARARGPALAPALANGLGNLASVLIATGDARQALQLLDESEQIRRLSEADRRGLAATIDNRGRALVSLGQNKLAQEAFQDALKIRTEEFVGDHPDIAESMHNLAWMDFTFGNIEESADKALRVLEMRRRLFPNGHPAVADSLRVMGVILVKQETPGEAEEYLRGALELRQKLFRWPNAFRAESLRDLANVLAKQEEFAEAAPFLEDLLKERMGLLGTAHPEVSAAANNLGIIYQKLNRLNEALVAYQDAAEIAARVPSPGDPRLEEYRTNIERVRKLLSS